MANNMTYQDAYDLLIQQIYAPVFFDKLATDYGVQASTEQEAREFLVLAGKLEQLDQAKATKQASDRTSFVSAASTNLDSLLSRAGISGPANVQADAEVKQAASKLAQVPHIRDAALLYQNCVKQLMANG